MKLNLVCGFAVLAVLSSSTGCASSTPSATATVTVTVTAPANEPTTSMPAPVTTAPSSSGAGDTPSEPPVAVSRQKAGKELTLADFFSPPSYWSQNRYDIADKTAITGISSKIDTYDEGRAAVLELRLANQFKRLTFNAGQANSSVSSNKVMIVQVLGNNDQQLEVQKISFNAIQPVSVDVIGVNAVKVLVYLDPASNTRSGSVQAVFSSFIVE